MEYTRTFSDCPGWVFTVTDDAVSATIENSPISPSPEVQRRMEELDWERRMAREWQRLRERTAPREPSREELTQQRDDARKELTDVILQRDDARKELATVRATARQELADAVRERDEANRAAVQWMEQHDAAKREVRRTREQLKARTIERDNARTELEHWRGPVFGDLAKLTAERDDARAALRATQADRDDACRERDDLRGLLADARERLRAARAGRRRERLERARKALKRAIEQHVMVFQMAMEGGVHLDDEDEITETREMIKELQREYAETEEPS